MMNAVIDDSSIDIKKVVMMMKSLFAPETWTILQTKNRGYIRSLFPDPLDFGTM